MANSTYRAIIEKVLRLSGRNIFSSDSEFNNGNIDSEKAALKEFFNLANQRYGRTSRGRSMCREFYLDTVDGTNDYDVNTNTSVDRLVPESWYITTAGEGGSVLFYPGGYYQYKRDFPEGETNKGCPRFWMYLPATDSKDSHICFSPPPDAAYRIYYSGYLRPKQLTQASDTVIWISDFEDGLVLAALSFLEFHKAEGKFPDIEAMLDPVFAEIESNNMGPVDEKLSIDLGIGIDSYGIY